MISVDSMDLALAQHMEYMTGYTTSTKNATSIGSRTSTGRVSTKNKVKIEAIKIIFSLHSTSNSHCGM